MTDITPGMYRHYKGGMYEVLSLATHTETNETLVIYRDSDQKIWARPHSMFSGSVNLDEQTRISRFTRIDDAVKG